MKNHFQFSHVFVLSYLRTTFPRTRSLRQNLYITVGVRTVDFCSYICHDIKNYGLTFLKNSQKRKIYKFILVIKNANFGKIFYTPLKGPVVWHSNVQVLPEINLIRLSENIKILKNVILFVMSSCE